jgi:uncharacterized protein (DUF488 family)
MQADRDDMITSLPARAVLNSCSAEPDAQFSHRRLLADYLLLQGLRVLHIDAKDKLSEHMLSAELRCEGAARVYDCFPAGSGRA